MEQREEYYAYWLAGIQGVGNRTIEKLIAAFKTPMQIYKATEKELGEVINKKQREQLLGGKEGWDLKAEYEALKKKDISYVWLGEGDYPQRLKEIPDAPFSLFFRGKLPEDELPAVAIIGARDCSQYGSFVAAQLGEYLGDCGVQVISGMARGIDGDSQRAALKAGGTSFGVLGCGVDVCYPASNKALYENLIQRGGVLSEYLPGTLPLGRNFPPRNRIVSGLCDALVVIEARNKSGTLITVDMALEQGKEVYVVPGRITDRLSDGCNLLLKQGAGVFLSPRDFYEQLLEIQNNKGPKKPQKKSKSKEGRTGLFPKEGKLEKNLQEVYKVLDFMPQSIEEIRAKLSTELSMAQLSILLMQLCVEGYVQQLSPGQFCVKMN